MQRCVQRVIRLALALLVWLSAVLPAAGQDPHLTIHVGYFPNVIHSQAVIGRATGAFDKALLPARLDWKVFNAGPSVIEALFAGSLDLAYVGPNPTITGFTRSRGEALHVIAGATSGGAALIVRPAANINKPEDFHGKRIASPQLGNTQDVALRAWLLSHGMKPREKGGDVQIIPISNPDQLILFIKGEIDAAWAPEPWASRLIVEANGRMFLDERDLWPGGEFVTAHLIVSTAFLQRHADLVKRWLRAHAELTTWINQNSDKAQSILNEQIRKDTGKALPAAVLQMAFSRMHVTCDPVSSSLIQSAQMAFDAGLLGRQRPELSKLYDLSLLNEVLREKGAKPIDAPVVH